MTELEMSLKDLTDKCRHLFDSLDRLEKKLGLFGNELCDRLDTLGSEVRQLDYHLGVNVRYNASFVPFLEPHSYPGHLSAYHEND